MNRPPIQPPELVGEDKISDGKVYQHPSWGVVHASRVSGLAALFGSALKHYHYIVLSIGRARKIIAGDGDERISGVNSVRGEIVEVAMSECPADETKENFHRAIESNVADAAKELAALRAELAARFQDAKPIGKGERQEIIGKLNSTLLAVENRLPFIQRMLHEKVEEQVAAAKNEVDGYLQLKMQALGFQAAQGAGTLPGAVTAPAMLGGGE